MHLSFYFPKTVETITAGLSRIVADLEAHIGTQRTLANQHDETMSALAIKKDFALAEADKADAVRAKIAALLS